MEESFHVVPTFNRKKTTALASSGPLELQTVPFQQLPSWWKRHPPSSQWLALWLPGYSHDSSTNDGKKEARQAPACLPVGIRSACCRHAFLHLEEAIHW